MVFYVVCEHYYYYYHFWPLCSTTCVRTGGFCWSKVLLPTCPCWWQL